MFFVSLAVLYIAWGIQNNAFRVLRSKRELARACELLIMKAYKAAFGLRHHILGLENLPPGPKILAANHPNASDGIQLPLGFKERITFIAQGSLFRLPLIGWILTHAGHIPVQPGQRHATFEQACKAISEGVSILIFPEGKLNPEKEEVKIGTGTVRMSLATGARLPPMVNVTVRRVELPARSAALTVSTCRPAASTPAPDRTTARSEAAPDRPRSRRTRRRPRPTAHGSARSKATRRR